jgi:hypothetical protein
MGILDNFEAWIELDLDNQDQDKISDPEDKVIETP